MSRLCHRLAFALVLLLAGPAVGDPPAALDAAGDLLPPAARVRFGLARLWHGPTVTGLVFTPDGRSIITAATEPVIRKWDAVTGKEIGRFQGHEGKVHALALRPDGVVLATAGEDKTVRLWNVATGRELRRWVHPEPYTCLQYSPDGRTLALALAGEKQTAIFLDPEAGKEVRRFTFPLADDRRREMMLRFGMQDDTPREMPDTSLSFVPGGRNFIYRKSENIFWCDAVTGKKLRRYVVPDTSTCLPQVAPDGRSLAAGSDTGVVCRWEADSIEELPRFQESNAAIFALAFAPDGKVLATAGNDGSVRLLDLTGAKQHRKIKADGSAAHVLSFSPDGKTLATGEASGAIRLWDVAAGKEQLLPGVRPAFASAAFNEDGSALVSAEQGRVRHWDARTGKETRQVNLPAGPKVCGVLSPRGEVVVLRENDQVLLMSTSTGKELSKVTTGNPLAAPLFTPDGKNFSLNHGDESASLQLLAVDGGNEVRSFARTDGLAALAFTPDGSMLVSGGPGRRLSLLETASGKVRRQFRVTLSAANWNAASGRSFMVTPDGRLLAAVQGESIALVDLVTGKIVRRFDGHEAVTQPEQGELIQVGRGSFIRQLGGQTEDVTCLAVSPDGKLLASGGRDQTVRLWEIATGSEKARLIGHRAAVLQVAFAPDGRGLLSTAEDHTALLWEVAEALRGIPQQATRHGVAGEQLWACLADENSLRADDAVLALMDTPAVAVPLLGRQLRPAPLVSRPIMEGLLEALDSPLFSEREKASRELTSLRDRAAAALRRTLENPDTSAEVRRRARSLLEEFDGGEPPGEWVREVRAIEVLERIGGPAACGVLETLARGDPDALLTRRAREALKRLSRAALAQTRGPAPDPNPDRATTRR